MEKKASKKINDATRKIYLKQHSTYFESKSMFDRYIKMVADPKYFHLEKEDFKGKHVLDAGCGNSAYLEVGLWKFGVGRITCLDLGKEWISPLKKTLNACKVPDDLIDFVSGSTDKLPFPDEHFDIVFSNGVLMHLSDTNQIENAWKELARVTKKGGHLYVLMGCPGGILEEEVWPAVRRYYARNTKFKKFIDNISPEVTKEILKFISLEMKKNTGESFDYNKAAKLFDQDLCTTIQNVVQAPTRHIVHMDKNHALNMFKELGFEKPKQCKRYVKRTNLRKFVAPLHYNSSNSFSELMYGPGNLEYIAKKK